MNIFQVLSEGKGRLHEPSMSAMLGYLLDSRKDHGLGDSVVRGFLKTINEGSRFDDILKMDFITTDIFLEEPYSYKEKENYIDIQLTVLIEENKEWKELHRIIIENKIKSSSARKEQLNDYYLAVINDEPDMDELTFVFLTPNNESKSLKEEYSNLSMSNENHKKFRVYWGSGSSCVSTILKNILTEEMNVEINPINEYMRHTLKSFIRHSVAIEQKNKKVKGQFGKDLGEIINEVDIEINNIAYTILKRDSGQIQIINRETGNKESARSKLLDFVKENNIELSGALSQGTRGIGKKCIEWQNRKNV
jgi:hypothetical protein